MTAPDLSTTKPGKIEPGIILTVTIPGERIRAMVKKIVRKGQLLCQIENVPMAKGHNYRQGDMIAVKHSLNALGHAQWIAIPELDPATGRH